MQGKRRRTTKIGKACVPAHHLLFNCFLKNSVDNMLSTVIDFSDQRVAEKSCEGYFIPKDTMKTLIPKIIARK